MSAPTSHPVHFHHSRVRIRAYRYAQRPCGFFEGVSKFLFALALVPFFVALVAVPGYGESVLVAVEDTSEIEDGGEKYSETSRFHLTAIEDGLMEMFFEEGHIVFNRGTYEHTDDSDIRRRYVLRGAAEEGGAAVVAQLSVSFERLGEADLTPERVSYELWEVDDGKALVSGERSAPFELPDEQSQPGSKSAALGRQVAEDMLSKWRP